MCANSRASPATDRGHGTNRAWCCRIPSASFGAAFSAWSAGAKLGRGAARIAEAFGMHIIIANRHGLPPQAGRVQLDELLATADIVSLHCPLTDATRGLIGSRELALMKPDALLINTARGALVDGVALAAALKAGRLGGQASMSCRKNRRTRTSPSATRKFPTYW